MGKTLITGATGLVGFQIASLLASEGRELRVLVRSPDKARRLLSFECEIAEGDVTDSASIERAVDGCDVVYHAAGLPEQWLPDDATFGEVNAGGTQRVAKAAHRAGVRRFVYTSTIDVFRGTRGATYDETELDPAPKGTAYERSKQEADRIVCRELERGLPAVFLHPGAVYGPGPAGSPGINDLCARLRDGRLPSLLPGGMPVVFATDVGRAHLRAEAVEPGRRYILAERYVTLVELARIIADALGQTRIPPTVPLSVAKAVSAVGTLVAGVTQRPPLIPAGQLEFLQWGAIADGSRASRELGIDYVPLEEGIRRTVEHLAKPSG